MATFRGDMTYVWFFQPDQSDEYNTNRITRDIRLGADGPFYEYGGQFTYTIDENDNVVDFDGVVEYFTYSYTEALTLRNLATIDSISLSVAELKSAGYNKNILLPELFSGNDTVEGNDHASGNYDPDEVLNGYAGNDVIHGYDGNDTIDGGEGADLMDGGTGIDTMTGGTGNDMYVVDDRKDHIVEKAGEGYDKAASSVTFSLKGADVEALTLTGSGTIGAVGNELNNKIVGNGAGNKMQGVDGSDALYGGLGRDALYGGLGNDAFVFDTAPAANNLDVIYDFANVAGDNDTIRLDDAVFTALPAPGRLAPTAFAQIDSSSATVSSDAHILYNQASGALFYDADGGTASGRVQFALLSNHVALTYKDFLVV